MDIDVTGSKIVIADDSFIILKKLEMFLLNLGYQVFTASDGKQALELIDKVNPDLIILDLYMPFIDGVEVCRIVKNDESTCLVPVIILTSSSSKDDKNLAISVGANDFINKTYETVELKLKVESLLKLKHAIDHLENANNIIRSLAKAVEVKDKYTEGHAERVSLYAAQIGMKLKLSEQQIKDLAMAGLLHDIGKIGIVDTILNKTGRLTEEEFNTIKQHPVIGEEICSPIKSFERVKKIIRHHHEKLNGKGYPDGIDGSNICIEIRIMTVADIYDALTSDRSYRDAMGREMAIAILEQAVSNGEVDQNIVSALKEIIHEDYEC